MDAGLKSYRKGDAAGVCSGVDAMSVITWMKLGG